MLLDNNILEIEYNISSVSLDTLQKHIIKSDRIFEDATDCLDRNKTYMLENRLYYSCYHITKALFYLYGLKAESHYGLFSMFTKYFIHYNKMFNIFYYDILVDSFERRRDVDYQFDIYLPEDSLQHYNECKLFIETLKEHIKNGFKKLEIIKLN